MTDREAVRAEALEARDQEACRELVAWWDSGVLLGSVLRDIAAKMVAAGKADESHAIQQAERAVISRAIRAFANAGAAPEGWRQIETAPKDGSYILLAVPNHDGDMTVGHWDDAWSDDGWWLLDDGKNFEIPLRGKGPTHWMPLPAAPVPNGREDG